MSEATPPHESGAGYPRRGSGRAPVFALIVTSVARDDGALNAIYFAGAGEATGAGRYAGGE